jgi:hypothetical protein
MQLQFHQQRQGPGNQYNARARQNTNPGARQREAQQKQVEGGTTEEDAQLKSEKKQEVDPNKQAKVICFNCAQWGHFSTDCRELKLCFICQTSDHVGRDCPEWTKPLESAQYLGSATEGLCFLSCRRF